MPVAIAFGIALSTAVKYAPKTDYCLGQRFDASLIAERGLTVHAFELII